MELPQKYLDAMKELLGDDFQAYIDSFGEKRLYGLRVNNLKISTEDFLKISPFKLKRIPWIENGFYYEEDEKPAKHPYYFAGLYYLQEPSAMTPANILPIKYLMYVLHRGERVPNSVLSSEVRDFWFPTIFLHREPRHFLRI